MGISMAICELDTKDSLCKDGKSSILKARLDNIKGLETCADYDEVVKTSDAKNVIGAGWEQFSKKYRIDSEKESFLLEKIKDQNDAAKLRPVSQKIYSGWIVLSKAPKESVDDIVKRAGPDNLLLQWDTVPLDETNKICERCSMSWDKGRGCIGAFGPDNSQLPAIAAKYNCKLIAKIPELAKTQEKLSPNDAKELIEECNILKEKLPLEGKAPAHRYGGVVIA